MLLVACGSDSKPSSNGSNGSNGSSSSGATTTTSIAGETTTLKVYFLRDEKVGPAGRTVPKSQTPAKVAMEQLLAGPTAQDKGAKLDTAIPPGTTLHSVTITNGVATVDLSGSFASGGGSLSMQGRVAQVVYTLTQFPTVKGVLFELDGQRVDVLGGEGVVVDEPVTRKDYRDLLPAILVVDPQIGTRVNNPVVVQGTANVFEANVQVDVVDASGKVVGSAFTTATCGTGCRGTFSVRVPYEVTSATRGLIIVHDDDAAGTGTPPHEVRIPVVLTPSS
jgi:germination protein M